MSKKVRGSAFDFSSTMTGGGVTWQRSRTFTVSNEAMWARWYKNATEVLQIYTNFDHLRLHKIQDEVHTPAFFPKKNWRVPNLWAFYKFGGRFGMNNIGGSGRVCLKWWGFSMFLVPCASCASWCKFRMPTDCSSIIYIYSHPARPYPLFIYF